ncbi:MAG: SDR family NAD(P)-dependent oxidoreductase, partial [Owenweeksia sp.]
MKKVALITGCSSGFGRITAQTLAKDGYTVYASMRDIEDRNAREASELNNWASKNGSSIRTIELDVT